MDIGKKQEISYLNITFGRKLNTADYDKIFEYLDNNITDDYISASNTFVGNEYGKRNAIIAMLCEPESPIRDMLSDSMLYELADYLVKHLL